MNKLKKILKVFLIVLLAMIVLLFAGGYLFRGKIVGLVKTEINRNINATVDFQQVDISFFRHFPKVSIGLDDVQVTGTSSFAKDTLLYAKRLDAAIDIMSFFRGSNMSVYSVSLDAPRIHALRNKEGLVNWDILKPDSLVKDVPAEAKPFNLQLQKYSITDGYIFYDDRQADMTATISNLNHSGSGDFTADLFNLATSTHAGEVTYVLGGVPFLNKVNASIDADLKVDNTNSVYSFENLSIVLNDLKITGSGSVKDFGTAYGLNISFKSADADFKNILSMIPAVYKKEFDKVTATGTGRFEGTIKGRYSDSTLPGYHVALEVKNGSFKYSDLPKAVKQINLKAVVDNPDGNTDNTIVNITEGHLQIDNDPFDFRLLLKKPVTAMYVDAAARGKLDLSQVRSYVKLEKGTSIAGLLDADVSVKGNVNSLEKEQYQDFYAAGTVDLNRFNYTSKEYPTGIKIHTLHTIFSPAKIDISNLKGEYMGTNFAGLGHINNLLHYLFSGKPLNADIAVNADKVNLDDWIGNQAETETSASPTAPFVVPENLDVALHTRVGQVHYDKLDINDLSGSLLINDETVKLDNVHGQALDGSLNLSGSYSTKINKAKPAIVMSYDVKQVDVQKTFYAFNSVQKLMPVGKFLAGKLTSSLSANGKLGEGMTVDMNTLSGEGNLLLIEGFLSKFAPLEKIASTLNVSRLQQISLKDVKAYFEFSNGKMLVKPFNVKLKDIEMEIGGLHGFDETIDYTINLKLPRSLMGTQGNQLLNNLAASVSNRGIPVNLGETVNLRLGVTGTIKSPSVSVDLKQTAESLASQMKDQVKEFAQAKIDSAKSVVKDTLNSIKKQLGEAVKDELTKKLFSVKDSTTAADSTASQPKAGQKAKESVKGALNNILKKKAKDTAK